MYISKDSIVSCDAGHNIYPDVGSIGYRYEDECTKEVCYELIEKLKLMGYKVKDCTPWGKSFTSVGESLAYRVRLTNESNSSIHLCIHFNSSRGRDRGRGVECWVSELGGRAENFAKQICSEISKLGYYNRGVKYGELYILKYTKMPSVLIECAFVDSKNDMERYNAEQIAEAIIRAIIKE